MNEPRLTFDLGFAPDADPMRPGVVTDCFNMIPTDRGMRTLPGVYPPDPLDTLESATFTGQQIIGHEAMWVTEYGTGFDIIAGAQNLYTRDSATGVYQDVSRTAGYTAISATVWSFERFGNFAVGAACTNGAAGNLFGAAPVQSAPYGPGGQFTDISGAPTCGILASAERFVLAFNGQSGEQDSWACCARDNHLSWTASPSTLANSGRLVDPPGPITAAKALGNDVAVYKNDAIIIGRFTQGDSEVWRWTRTRHRVGAVAPRAVCVLDDGRHAFIGRESCYLFDGTNVIDVLDGRARKWYKQTRGPLFAFHQFGAHYDTANKLVWFTFTDRNSGLNALVLDPNTGRLGRVSIQAHLGGTMIDAVESGSRVFGYFDSVQNRRWTFPRSTSDDITPFAHPGWLSVPFPYIVTGDYGSAWDLVQINGVRLDTPYGATGGIVETNLLTRDTRRYANVVDRAGIAVENSDYERFDVRATGHWHRVRMTPKRMIELSGVTFDTPTFGGRRK